MIIKKVTAKSVKDSRGEKTIQVIVKTSKGRFKTSAPCGKSKGRFEVKSYAKNLENDVDFINCLKIDFIIESFEDLKKIEKLVIGQIGGNSLFALEASLLKALAQEKGKELWEFLGGVKIPRSVGNAIGGGLHSKVVNRRKPDFQEFLFIGNGKTFKENVKINKKAYKLAKKFLKSRRRNDEGAWETDLGNEQVLEIMNKIKDELKKKGLKIDIGLDIASSSFYKNGRYYYKNPAQKLSKSEQINYIKKLIKKYNLLYVEDPLNENDFSGFRGLIGKNYLIVGDDLTTTNPERLNKAIRMQAINGIIVKPNQIGSLLKVKKVIELAKKYKIKTIMSHRSGETKDNTIADLAVGWDCDFIKTGIYGSVRKAKLKRLVRIEKTK